MLRRRYVASSVIVVGLVAATAAVIWALLTPLMPKIDGSDQAQVARGVVVYSAQCARCHGANLEGQPNWRERQANGRLPAPPHDETGHTWHHTDSVLFSITKYGIAAFAPPGYESDMPAFDGVLTDADIAAVIAFIKSKWPPEVRSRQERINE